MKEILYIQAGSQANYIGTHFWNTQESYFTYEDEEAPATSHGISFREGLNKKGEPTFCPRLLAFDHKARFGTLSQANALFGMDDATDEQILWSATPVQYKQEPVRKSDYQTSMEGLDLDAGSPSSTVQLTDIQYWSDFNRMYYIPRTVQKVPDIPDWEDIEGNWAAGKETFARYNEDTDLMEGSLRLFLEECETIQGVQLMHDTSTFGSFVDSFLTSLRDDFVKLPLLAWPLLSDVLPSIEGVDDKRGRRKIINDALVLRSLSELSSMNIPIQSPTTWTDDVCRNTYLQANQAHAYHTSAILSALIETATLPLRLGAPKDDISDLCAQLSWRTALPFAELSGVFPRADTLDLEKRIYNFSTAGTLHATHTLAAAYSLPTSFPPFFSSGDSSLPLSGPSGLLSRPKSTSVFASIAATSRSGNLFSGYARFLEQCTRRKISMENAGIDFDEMGDLANDLWTLHDNAGGEMDDNSDTDMRGEDEE
ncbi:Misato segment II tubulin-like domain-containing protein [Mycena belliarum]|uniref:Misato segment II tubulin-like domain-containing protein n=1 Tax=Mycena belliarum TaxID=1033014 RepID=A0AAD6XTB3_9AGAR|nr:Misato segment II tubulin-like domain-containing protein [Mycena belliae]